MKQVLSRIFILFLVAPASVWAQRHELGFTLGGTANDLSTSLNVRASSGRALHVNYGYRFLGNNAFSLSGELHLLANPLREISGANSLTRDFASLYLTPGDTGEGESQWAALAVRSSRRWLCVV